MTRYHNRVTVAAAAIALVAAALAASAGRAGAQARTQDVATSGTVDVGGAMLRYDAQGTGEALVFIHGWALDRGVWDRQVEAFAPSFRVIRYDLRGFGESTGDSDDTLDPDDLRILLDSLRVRTAHVVGLSRGANVALRFAVHFPERVRSVVLYGLGPPRGFPGVQSVRAMLTEFREIARNHGVDSLKKAVLLSPLAWRPPGVPFDVDSAARAWRYDGRDMLNPVPPSGRIPHVTTEQAAGVRAPVLLLHGQHEMPLMQAVADSLLLRIPGARKVVIPDGGHGVHMLQPERFNRALSDFFATLPRGPTVPPSR